MRLMEQMQGRFSILGQFLGLELSRNPGIALGIRLPDPWQQRVIFAAIILVAIAAFYYQESKEKAFAFGLILGGAVSNIIDRMLDGSVTDYVVIGSYPSFNMADAAICIGVGLLIWENIFDR